MKIRSPKKQYVRTQKIHIINPIIDKLLSKSSNLNLLTLPNNNNFNDNLNYIIKLMLERLIKSGIKIDKYKKLIKTKFNKIYFINFPDSKLTKNDINILIDNIIDKYENLIIQDLIMNIIGDILNKFKSNIRQKLITIYNKEKLTLDQYNFIFHKFIKIILQQLFLNENINIKYIDYIKKIIISNYKSSKKFFIEHNLLFLSNSNNISNPNNISNSNNISFITKFLDNINIKSIKVKERTNTEFIIYLNKFVIYYLDKALKNNFNNNNNNFNRSIITIEDILTDEEKQTYLEKKQMYDRYSNMFEQQKLNFRYQLHNARLVNYDILLKIDMNIKPKLVEIPKHKDNKTKSITRKALSRTQSLSKNLKTLRKPKTRKITRRQSMPTRFSESLKPINLSLYQNDEQPQPINENTNENTNENIIIPTPPPFNSYNNINKQEFMPPKNLNVGPHGTEFNNIPKIPSPNYF